MAVPGSDAPAAPPGVGEPFLFDEPLEEGLILARPNRFVMDVALGGETVRCHCPVVSRIGGLDLSGRPCLVSRARNPRRKYGRTVEAFSLARPGDERKSWVGINQSASNRYVEHFLEQGVLAGIKPAPGALRREVRRGSSRLDFAVGDELFVEVKTPLVQLQTPVPSYVPRLPEKPFSSTDRALRHLRELAASLDDHGRAVVLYCLYYENDGFRFYHGTTYDEVRATVAACEAAGVELWQADFSQDARGVSLVGSRRLKEW